MSLVWLSLTVSAQGIDFRDLTYQEAIEAAEAEGKPIFMDCYTTWCGPCKWMSANIFPQEEMGDYFNENFVCVKFDMEKGEGLDIAKEFKVRAYPTLLFIDQDRELLNVMVGASREVADYIEAGSTALDPKANMPYLSSHKEENIDDPEFMRRYIAIFGEAGRLEEGDLDKYLAQFPVEQWGNDNNWYIISNNVEDPNSAVFQKIVANEDQLKAEQGSAVSEYIEQVLYYHLARKRSRARSDEAIAEYQNEKSQLLASNDFSNVAKLRFRLNLFELQRSQDWERYCATCVEEVKDHYWNDADQLNSIAWAFFEKTDNKDYLKKAEEWAARAVKLDKQHHILDTQANLLYKLGKYEKALVVEQEALEMAQARGEDTESYQEVIAKIKAAQKG